MGLAEKRVVEEIKQKWNESWQKRIQDAVQAPVPIEVRFETIVKESDANYALTAFEKVYVDAAVEGFKSVCKDTIGKEAVAASLKKIVIQNVSGSSNGDTWATYSNGTLTLDHALTNVDYAAERVKGLVNTLSKSL